MSTKLIRKIASIIMVIAVMFSTLATPVSNIGKVIVQATEESEIIMQEVPTDEVGNEAETTPSDVEVSQALETNEIDQSKDVASSLTEEPPSSPVIETTEATSSIEVPSTQTCYGDAKDVQFSGAEQVTENGELVNKIGLNYSRSMTANFNTKYTITEVRLVQDEVNAGDDAETVEELTLVGPITNPTLEEFDPSRNSVLPPSADTYTATWDLEPIDIYRVQTFFSGNHTNVKIYYKYQDKDNPSCTYIDVTNNNKTSLYNFQVNVPEPTLTVDTCISGCTSIDINVDYVEFKNALDITDNTDYVDYYDSSVIQIILQDPLNDVPVALDLDGETGGVNTTSVDMSGENNDLTSQYFSIDLAPYFTNPDGTINLELYEEHEYTVNILVPNPENPNTPMIVASISDTFDLTAPLAIDSNVFTAVATPNNTIEITYQIAANDYTSAELEGEIVITNVSTGEEMDIIKLTGEEIKDSATTPINKTSTVAYADNTTYRVTLNVYAKDSNGNKIDCSEAIAYKDVTMQDTTTLNASECITNCTSVILTPTIDPAFYDEEAVMSIYLNDGENEIQLDLDPTSGVSYYQSLSTYDPTIPFCIDLTKVFTTYDSGINPKVYLSYTYTLKIFNSSLDTTTPIKTVTSNPIAIKQPPIISGLTTIAEYDNHITIDYIIDDKGYDNLTGDIKIYSADGETLYETITLSEDDIDNGVAKTSTLTYAPGVEYKIALDVYAHDEAGNIIECSQNGTTTLVTMKTIPKVTPYQMCDDECNVTFAFEYDGSMYPEGSDINILATNTNGTEDVNDDVVLPVQKAGETVTNDNTMAILKFELPNDSLAYTTYHYDISIETSDGIVSTVDTDYTLLEKPSINTFETSYEAGELTIVYDYSVNGFEDASASINIYRYEELYMEIPLQELSSTIVVDQLLPGEYTTELVIDYSIANDDCIAVTQDSAPINVAYPNPSITPSQACDEECIVNIDLEYDASMYPADSEVVVLQDDVEVLRYSITDTSHNVEGTNTYSYQLVVEDYDAHEYVVYIDTMMDETYLPVSKPIEFALLEKPSINTFETSYEAGDLTIVYDYNVNGFEVASASINIYRYDELYMNIPIKDLSSTIVVDHLLPGEYTAEFVIDYSIANDDCIAVTQESESITIAYPKPSITPSQACDAECIVNIDLEYDASMYPADSEVVVLQDDEEVLRYSIADMSHNVAGTNTYNYQLIVEDYDTHNYVVYIDTMMGQEYLPSSEQIEFALLEKPSINIFETSYEAGELTITYDYSVNGFDDASASINIYNYEELYMAIPLENHNDTIVLENILPGDYTMELVIDYSIGADDCIAITQANEPITVTYPNPTITPYQDCAKECLVDIALEYDASMYPTDSEVVVLQDETEVLRYSISDTSNNVEGTNVYNYELATEDYDSHDYVVYIDTMMDEENVPSSEVVEFALLEKPEVKLLTTTINSDDTITIEYDVDLNDCPDATGTLAMTNSYGDTKTYNIDSESLANGSYTTNKLPEGEYQATLTIDYWGDCPTIIFESKPIEIKHKLAYTGFELSTFESFIINIQETILNITK